MSLQNRMQAGQFSLRGLCTPAFPFRVLLFFKPAFPQAASIQGRLLMFVPFSGLAFQPDLFILCQIPKGVYRLRH